MEECQKKKEVTTPPQLSFLSPICFFPPFSCVGSEEEEEKEGGLLKIN